MDPDPLAQRAQILEQMAALSTMELGSVTPLHRPSPSGEPRGPYYKYQVWENGAKQSGMFWGLVGAENILALRCIHASGRIDSFWKDRRNALAARNDTLALAA